MANQEQGFEEKLSAFVREIEGYLAKGDGERAVDAVQSSRNYDVFKASGFELIPLASRFLTTKTKDEKPPLFKAAKEILQTICVKLTPQETYLELLEQAETDDDVKFTEVLVLVGPLLWRMPKQRGKSMRWACDTIVRHLCHMDYPKSNEGDDAEETAVVRDNSDIMGSIVLVYSTVQEFFETFAEEVVSEHHEVATEHMPEYRDSMMTCLLKCLGRPLVHVDLSKGRGQILASQFMSILDAFVDDPLALLNHVDLSFGCVESLEEDVVSMDFNNVSLGCYFYLIFRDEGRLQRISHVFSTQYLSECVLAMAFDLMSTDESPLMFKALELFNAVLDRMSPKTVEFNSIKDTVMSKFLEMITRSMVHNKEKEVRQLIVKTFPKLLSKFTPEGQYLILFNANQLSAHPGFVGYAVTLFKELVREALDSKNPAMIRYFTGKKLVDFLSRYCRISGLVEADLQSHTDQIISCLNLIRYLALRDRTNEADIAPYMTRVDESYVEPVKKACNFARGLYEDYKAEVNKPADPRLKIQIGGSEELLPEMSANETVAMMNENLTRVDMIDYLASRVTFCLVEYKKNLQVQAA